MQNFEWEHVLLQVCRDEANKSFYIRQMILFTLVFKNVLFFLPLSVLDMAERSLKPYNEESQGVDRISSVPWEELSAYHQPQCRYLDVPELPKPFPPFLLFPSPPPPFLGPILQLMVFAFSLWVLGKKGPHVEDFAGTWGQWTSVHFHC